MRVYKIKDMDIKFTADMTRQLFEDEPSIKCLTMEQYESRLQNYLRTGCEVFHFVEDTIVVGYALVNKARNPYYLIDFFICRDCRRKGNGTVAFNLLLNALNTKDLDLDVFCWNDRGRAFWKSLGFNEVAIIMSKREASE